MRVLVVDDDNALCRSLQLQLGREGHDVVTASDLAEGRQAYDGGTFDIVFLDLRLPDGSGLDLLSEFRDERGAQLIVMISGVQDMEATIKAVRLGAFDYIRKPLDIDAVLLVLEKAGRTLSESIGKTVLLEQESSVKRREIVGADPKIVEAIKQIGSLSQNRVPVLIVGESGTGKELVARALHEAATPDRPFVAVNCSAVVPTLLESELFGHEKGAFTGADRTKPGKLEIAGRGTIFFDEIGDMALDFQAKLLRVLQERAFERVGGVELIPLNARVLAATNRDLGHLAAEKRFREDLLFRLSVARVTLPPLRERRGDIRLLAKHMLTRISREVHKDLSAIEEDALRRLEMYDWPGNVRELENVLTRAALLTQGAVVTNDAIAGTIGSGRSKEPTTSGKVETLQQAESKHVYKALLSCDWNITHAAEVLDISPTTLRKKIADYRLKPPRHS